MREEEVVKQALIDLEYHIQWLEYKLINEIFLLNQYQYFLTSEDKCTEHYRYAAFQNILREHQSLNDETIDKYIRLAELDNDLTMSNSALMNLFTWQGLNEEQYTKLVNHSTFSHKIFQRYHQNKILTQSIDSMILSDEIVEFYIENYDSRIQEYLLNKEGLSRKQVEYISQHGKNKRIKNIAKNLLRSRLYQ
jgi:hypothetical protein